MELQKTRGGGQSGAQGTESARPTWGFTLSNAGPGHMDVSGLTHGPHTYAAPSLQPCEARSAGGSGSGQTRARAVAVVCAPPQAGLREPEVRVPTLM